MRSIKLLAPVAIVLLSSSLASGQSSSTDVNGPTDTGLPVNAIISGSAFDNVRINNGNLHIEIPVISLKGRGQTVVYRYVYDNKGWAFDIDPNVGPPQGPVGTIRPGPTQQFRYLSGPTYAVSFSPQGYKYQCGEFQGTPEYAQNFGGYALIEADGTKHPFQGTIISALGATTCAGSQPNTTLFSTDGSGWIMKVGFTASDVWPVMAIRKDGAVVNFAQGSGAEVSLVDRNGNILSGTTDTLGRTAPSPNGSYYDSNGTLRTVAMTPVQVPVQTALCPFFGLGSEKCSEDKGHLSQPQTITLPDGLTYQFTYEQNQYGEPNSVILPSGAQISWTWGSLDSGGRKVTSRTVTIGGQSFTWQYNYGLSGANPPPSSATWTNSIIDPLGNETDYICKYLFVTSSGGTSAYGDPGCTPIEVRYYQGSAATGTLIKTVDTSYLTTGAVLPTSVTTTGTKRGRVQQSKQIGDSGINNLPFRWGNPVEVREFGFDGSLIKRTDYDYLHLNSQTAPTYQPLNLAVFPITTTVYDGSGNMLAQTKTGYDETAVASTSTSPAPSHDYTNFGTGNNLRANATSVSQWRNTDGAFLKTSHTYDDLGNLRSTTDPNNNPTTFSYNDNWAASPNNSCVPSGTNTQAFVTLATNALNQNLKTAYYPCTGFV